MDKIVYAGSFDPLTKGHWWVIEQALELADKVVVFVAQNAEKKGGKFSGQERKDMIESVAKDHGVEKRIEVMLVQNEYVAVKAKKIGANYMIRGIRNSNDFDQEATLQRANSEVLMGAKTLFVMPPRELDGVSSSFVKAMVGPIGWHWQIKKFLPDAVYKHWIRNYIRESASLFVKTPNKYMISSGAFEFDKKNPYTVNPEKMKSVPLFIEAVLEAYESDGRYYHNLDHLVHCIQELHTLMLRSDTKHLNFEALFLAVLAHDMVYEKKGQDELKSAQKMVELLGEKDTKSVYDIVMATEHLGEKKNAYTENEKAMRSLDLAILAQPSFIYENYVKDVRKEYAQYSDSEYKEGRLKVLKMFLAMPKIYESDLFSHYEEDARINLENEVKQLES